MGSDYRRGHLHAADAFLVGWPDLPAPARALEGPVGLCIRARQFFLVLGVL